MSIFRLPTEILQRIFFHLLGGFLLRRRVSTEGKSQWTCYVQRKVATAERRYEKAGGSTLGERLELLLVCHRFYEETATMMFSENTFYFECIYQYTGFLRSLKPFQRHALRKYIQQLGATATKYTRSNGSEGFEAREVETVDFHDKVLVGLSEEERTTEVSPKINQGSDYLAHV